MAYEVQKLVLFRSANKTLKLDELVAWLGERALRAGVSGAFVYVREGEDESSPAVRLSVATDDHVIEEARRIAELHAAGRPDRTMIAACDARIEIAWKPDEWDDVVETVTSLDPDLEELARGVTWFANVKELSDGSFERE